MRTKFIVAAAVLFASISGALAQGVDKPKATLNAEVLQQIPDNSSNAITPANVRQVFNDSIASFQQAPQVNAQVGTSYTFLASDYGNLVTFNNASAVAVTLPQATGSFSPWSVFVSNRGSGTVTITPQGGSTINGAATLTIPGGGSVFIVADAGGNYQVSANITAGTFSIPIIPDTFCTVDRTGATDMAACINSAITAAKNCGSAGTATVYLRAGTYLDTAGIVPKSCVQIRGDGPGRTVILTNSNAPFGPPAGQQLVHCGLDGVTFKDSGTHASATVMTFPSIQDCKLTNIDFVGYSTGTLMSIATSAVSSFDDTNTIWNNSNAIFNYFLNWWTDGCTNCIKEAGHYGTTPTASPPNSSNVPDQLVTQNRYDNIILYCAGKCIDFIKAADTEYLTNILFKATSGAVVGLQIGDDPAFPGNNYTNAIYFQGSISLSGATSFTMAQAGNWTYANKIDVVSSDVPPGSLTTAVAQASVTQFKAEICIANVIADVAGFTTGKFCNTNNFSGTGDGQSTYYRIPNGAAANPVFGFANDSNNGFYLPAAGTFGFTKAVSSGANGGTGGQFTLNGATSGSGSITVDATGGVLRAPTLSTRQILPITSSTSAIPQATTGFFGFPTGLTTGAGAEAQIQSVAPVAGTFKNLTILSTAPAAGQTLAVTLRINNASTAVACTVTGPGTTCTSPAGNTAAITAGQTYDLQVVTSATTGSIINMAGGVEFDNP